MGEVGGDVDMWDRENSYVDSREEVVLFGFCYRVLSGEMLLG
jgi:hypothetical protein